MTLRGWIGDKGQICEDTGIPPFNHRIKYFFEDCWDGKPRAEKLIIGFNTDYSIYDIKRAIRDYKPKLQEFDPVMRDVVLPTIEKLIRKEEAKLKRE